MPLYLSEADVTGLITPGEAVPVLEQCFLRMASGAVENVPRRRLALDDGGFAVMYAVDRELGYAGVKAYTVVAGKAVFAVSLFDLRTGELAAVLEADTAGQRRTGAASGVAAKHLARRGASTLGVIGCGWQAESQVAAIRAAVPTVERVVAYCRTPERLQSFCATVGAEPAESHAEAAAQDIVVTITTSRDPVLRGEWLREGALVCAAGANDPRKRELDNVVLERASFVCCDSKENALLESGDLIEPVESRRARLARGARAPGDRCRRAAGPRVGHRRRRLQVERAGGVGRRDRRRAVGPRARARRRHNGLGGAESLAGVLDRVLADRLDDLRPVEQPCALIGVEAVLDVAVLENLGEVASPVVLADHVGGDSLIGRRPLGEEREQVPEGHGRAIVSSCQMRRISSDGRCAERTLKGFDDAGREERIVIWLERKQGALWAVGRAVNPQHRPSGEPRGDDYLFEGHELGDALEAANGALEDDARVLEDDGSTEHIRPFTRKEVLPTLERFFFGRR